jgi:hypothetical protein
MTAIEIKKIVSKICDNKTEVNILVADLLTIRKHVIPKQVSSNIVFMRLWFSTVISNNKNN